MSDDIPVFLCSIALEEDTGLPPHIVLSRQMILGACHKAWLDQWGFGLGVNLLTPSRIGCDLSEFQRERRIEANRLAYDLDTDIYIVADDDILPPCFSTGSDPLRSAMDRYPEFASISLGLTDHPIESREEVVEAPASGGVRVCRRLPPDYDWPPSGPGYDVRHAKALRERYGLKVGTFTKMVGCHLGRTFSMLAAGRESES